VGFKHKHRRDTHPSRVRSAIEHYLRHLAHRHPLLAVALSLVTVALCFVVVLVRVVTTVAVKTVVIAVRLTIVITLVVCRNIFRTFPA
jgi:hypothetical protein